MCSPSRAVGEPWAVVLPGARPRERHERGIVGAARALDEAPDGHEARSRDAAFRHTILEIYDYRCAACGIRVRFTDDLTLVQAAHITPFQVTRNDKPNNGLALCPNHHWAMDQLVIAPCPDSRHRAGVWRVHARLDDRIEGQKDLMSLSGRPLLPPREEKFYPAPEGLMWRRDHLATTY